MQPDTLPSTLSEALRYQIRTASLPLAMRSIFSHLPEPLVLEVSIALRSRSCLGRQRSS